MTGSPPEPDARDAAGPPTTAASPSPAAGAGAAPATAAHTLVVARFAAGRRHALAVFLWALMGVAASCLLARVVLGGGLAGGAPFAFLGLIVALLAAGLLLNRRRDDAVAVWLVTGAYLVAVHASQLLPGGAPVSPYHLFVPLALAGLMLRRRGLALTAAASVATVWVGPLNDLLAPAAPAAATPTSVVAALEFTVVYAAIALLLERFGITLRWALIRAAEQEASLLEEALEAKADLEAERELNEAIRESFPGVYYVVDEHGNYVQWNGNVLDMLAVSEEELARTNALELVAPEDRDAVRAAMRRALEAGSATVQARALAGDGRKVPLYLAAARVSSRDGPLVAGVGIDRRELDAARARIDALDGELRERLGTLSALHAIDAAVASPRDLRSTLGLILELTLDRLHLDAGNVLPYSAERERMVFGARRGFRDAEWRPVSIPVGHGIVGRCAEKRVVIELRGQDEIARHLWRYPQYAREGFESYVAVPLVANEELVGVMELFSRRRIAPAEDWHAFLRTVAAQAAIAIANATLIAGLRRSNEELTRSYDSTIEGWARALDLKDQETEGHSRRVTELSVELARRLGVRGEELTHVRRGALLHDIGKMGVPDAILLKPGRLDPGEWEVMKRHTTYAYELLKPIPFLWPAIDIPYLHHERWDGTGYPLGLKGDKIPRSARIFTVVDVYDALTNARPYRQAWSREEALAHIAAEAGRQFDPAIAAEFLRMMGADRSGRPAGEAAPVGGGARGGAPRRRPPAA